MKSYFNKGLIVIVALCIFSCCSKKQKAITNCNSDEVIATLNDENIFINQIDSIIGMQVYEQRLNALHMYVSREILRKEAHKKNIHLKELVNEEIVKKSKKITDKDIQHYIKQNNISEIDTFQIISYLENTNQSERQYQYIDSLKQFYTLRVKLRPPFYNMIEANNLSSQNITPEKSPLKVYIVSDFNCSSCQQAEYELQELYHKYNKKVNFRFVFYSHYIDNMAIACEAASKQNKFKEMFNKVFENSNNLHLDSIHFHLAHEIGLDIDMFIKDMQDESILKRLMDNKKYLLDNGVYMTPTFIVNNKILDQEYAIHYLEDIIKEELSKL